MAVTTHIINALDRQRGHLFQWVPVCLSFGVGGYFLMPLEPTARDLWMITGAVVVGIFLALIISAQFRPLVWMLVLVGVGAMLVAVRAHDVAAPVLGFRYYGPIEGRITKVDRSQSDMVRLTLDRVVLKRTHPARTPKFVRVSMHGQQGFIDPEPGLTVMMTGHLAPPSGPVEPGGFDFQRMAWFDQLGAVGYTRTPVLALYPVERGQAGLFLHRLRARIARYVQISVPGEDGAFAAALMTGDRSGVGQPTLEALRVSNLAHLLAISGLHMGLLTGSVFAAIRYGLALWPWVALRWPTKKVAAIGAMAAGAFYLALSGGNVATERAFVMVATMFVAILFDRRALTLRAVALAAVIILIFRPESLTEPGFQMSFAATTGLVAVFGAIRHWNGPRLPKWMRPVLAVVISSAVAGLATAPVSAAHFNRIADYGLIANLLAVPLMGIVVMPAAVLTACLWPLGLAWIGLWIMEPAIHWILGVAHHVAGLEGALSHVPSPSGIVLPLFAFGMLVIILWQGRERFVGLVPVIAAFWLWAGAERPAILISETGGLVGVMGDQGRVLNKAKGEGFAAQSWLENDGDGATQDIAALRPGFSGTRGDLRYDLTQNALVHLSGRDAALGVTAACETAALVVLAGQAETVPTGCFVLDRGELADLGAVALFWEGKGFRVLGSKAKAGQRLWNTRKRQRRNQNTPEHVRGG